MDFGNFVAAGTDFSSQESSSSQDPFSQSQGQDVFTHPGDGTQLGDKLLAQPYKVGGIYAVLIMVIYITGKLNKTLSVVWHHLLLLMNSFNKTEAVVFSCRLCFLRAFPFVSLILF